MSVEPQTPQSNLRSRFRVIENRVNPLYLPTLTDLFTAAHILYPQAKRDAMAADLTGFSFCHANGKADVVKETMRSYRDEWSSDTLLLVTLLPSPFKYPHHIHEDGSMEERRGRSGPIRTYYDGSHLDDVPHVAAIKVDKRNETITTQCSLGLPLPDIAEDIIAHIYGDYTRISISPVQQKDAHSSVPLALFNLLAMAGVHRPQTEVDVMAWRQTMLEATMRYEKEAEEGWHPYDAYRGQTSRPVYTKRFI